MVLHNTILFPQTIFLRSSDATLLINEDLKSDILFELKNAIQIPNNIDGYIQLNNFKFINSFYNINANNNIFYYTLHSFGVSTNHSITIPIGNYNITNLLSYLNNALTGQLILTYDSMIFKINFKTAQYPDANYSFSLNDGTNNILSVLGFDEPTSLLWSVISPNLINLAGVQSLYICLENTNLASNTSKQSKLNNILECININVPTGNSQVYQNTTNTKYKIGTNSITSISIKIFDENYNLVDFNNTDWSISMNLIFVYNMEYIPHTNLDLQPIQDEQNNNDIITQN